MMKMKMEKLYVSFALLLSVLFVASCSDDDGYDPILLSYTDGHDVIKHEGHLYFTPFSAAYSFYLRGGDGAYTVVNGYDDVIQADYDGAVFTIAPLSVGAGMIMIKDNSGNYCHLYFDVRYTKRTLAVMKHDCMVEGDNLTIGDKAKLEKEVLSAIPVNVGGAYELIETEPDRMGGKVIVYPATSGKAQEGTYVIEEGNKEEYVLFKLIVEIGEQRRMYSVIPYYSSTTRSSGSPSYTPPMTLIEDVTEIYKETYPALEKAYTLQTCVERWN